MKKISNKSIGNTSVEVLSIMPNGIFLSVSGNDYFLSYNRLPWFRTAKVSDILNVEMFGNDAIRWEALDIDLEIESLMYPEKYPHRMKRYEGEIL
jgi:ribosomal protein S1